MATTLDIIRLEKRFRAPFHGRQITPHMVEDGLVISVSRWSGDPEPFFEHDVMFVADWATFYTLTYEALEGLIMRMTSQKSQKHAE